MNSPVDEAKKNIAWTLSIEKALDEAEVLQAKGLSPDEVTNRLETYGPNRLQEVESISSFQVLVNQFKNLVVVLLIVAAGVSLLFHEYLDFGAILAVIIINAVIGFFTEIRAVRSMEALRSLGSVTTNVRRGGEVRAVPADNLVPGDIVIFEGGDIVTADMRLLTAYKLEADESSLTGESLPVLKNTEKLEKEALLAERFNMIFKGTSLTRGSGEALVISTGMNTELGRISSLVEKAEGERTPLEKHLDQMAHKLIWISLIIAVVVVIGGYLTGKELFIMIETGIALAIASIPEGLPIVATIALARGMWRMAKRNALVNRLSAVETLGATNIIFTDKTGTLTENRMTLTQINMPSGNVSIDKAAGENAFSWDSKVVDIRRAPALMEFVESMILCNNASLVKEGGESESVGDPLEIALLEAAELGGIKKDPLFEKMPEHREEAFDSDIKMMATYNLDGDEYRVSVKGAPEEVIRHCSKIRKGKAFENIGKKEQDFWIEQNNKMAENGLRVIAMAVKKSSLIEGNPYENLIFLGLMGLVDPPREDVRDAITLCRKAGIRIVVVTGDQLITARNVALAVNLVDDENEEVIHGRDLKSPDKLNDEEKKHLLNARLFARVSPEQKLDLIALHQGEGSVVAMTGDGVNDAPALKKADIGVAMGLRGTQVAREAADMVLKDDSFNSIAMAVEQGRIIFNNIRKFIRYLLSCNVSEVMIILFASLIFKELPILPLQILFLNFVTDVFPALALGVGEGSSAVMGKKPRDSSEAIITSEHWKGIFGYGLLITISVLAAFVISSKVLLMPWDIVVTISFLTLAIAQIWHVFNMRDNGTSFFKNEITKNPFVWGAVVLCLGLLLIAVYIPQLAVVLKVVPPGFNGWCLVIVLSLVPWSVGQIMKSNS
jgi:P-type Ca2+ transporter type 2C